jgi:hypothetical protein
MRWPRGALCLFLAGVAIACEEEEPEEPDVSLGGSQAIFTARCTEGCHSGEDPEAGLSLAAGEARANLIDEPAMELCQPGGIRLVPGDPDASCIWQLIDTNAMPFFEAPLADDEKDVIYQWIADGAPQ